MTEAEKKYKKMVESDAEVAKMLREANKATMKKKALEVLSGFDEEKMDDHIAFNKKQGEAIKNLWDLGIKATPKAIKQESAQRQGQGQGQGQGQQGHQGGEGGGQRGGQRGGHRGGQRGADAEA